MQNNSVSIIKIGNILDIKAPSWITSPVNSERLSAEREDSIKRESSKDKEVHPSSVEGAAPIEVDSAKPAEKEEVTSSNGEEGDDESADRTIAGEKEGANEGEEETPIHKEILSHLETKLFFWKDKEGEKQDDELYQKYSSRSATSFESPAKSGYLTKQGKIHKTWRERYFVLDGYLLFYFDNNKSERPNGVIDLTDCEVLKDVTRGKKNCFQVSHTKKREMRTFVFFAKNPEEMKSWISTLNAATRLARKSKDDSVVRRSPSGATLAPVQPTNKPRSKSFAGRIRPTNPKGDQLMAGHRKGSFQTQSESNEEKEGMKEELPVNDCTDKGKEKEDNEDKEKEKEKESGNENGTENKEVEKEKEGEKKENVDEEEGNWKEMPESGNPKPPTIVFLSSSKDGGVNEALLEKYVKLVEESETKLLAQVEPHGSETGQWKLVKEMDDILLSKRETGDPHIMTRVEGHIRAPVDTIMSLIRTLEYDPLMISLTQVARVTDDMDISKLCMRSPSPIITDRDFALLRFKQKNASSGRWVLGAFSIESDLIPEDGDYVRGHIIHSGWVLEPFGAEGKESFCTYVLALDPKGWAPTWLVNMFRTTNMYQSFTHLKSKSEAKAGRRNNS